MANSGIILEYDGEVCIIALAVPNLQSIFHKGDDPLRPCRWTVDEMSDVWKSLLDSGPS